MNAINNKPVCPFLGGKQCLSDGLRELLWNGTAHPCMFWDADKILENGMSPEPPCRIERALRKILSDEKPEQYDNSIIPEVPWDSKKE